jgi:hypothetical protein
VDAGRVQWLALADMDGNERSGTVKVVKSLDWLSGYCRLKMGSSVYTFLVISF